LYRHFPTRAALLEEVYGAEVEKLAAAREGVYQDNATGRGVAGLDVALRRYIATKQIIAPALNTLLGEHCNLKHQALRS